MLVFLAMRSPWGRVLKGIREDEDAVRSLGKNVFAYKIQALIFGGVIGTLGGFVFALSNQSVQPDNYATTITFFAWAVLILGGAARVFGPVLGAVIFWFLLVFINVLPWPRPCVPATSRSSTQHARSARSGSSSSACP